MADILYVTNMPTPYRLPLYRALAARLAERGDRLTTFFLGYARSERAWRIDADELAGFEHVTARRRDARVVGELIARMRRTRPAVVVIAWAMDHVALAVLVAARWMRIPVIVVTGETVATASHYRFARLRRAVRQAFFKGVSGFVTYGSQATAYLLGAGVPAARITTGINTVDVERFARQAAGARASGAASAARAAFRQPDNEAFAAHLLFVGYLHGEKGAAQAIDALALAGRPEVALHIVGSGPDEGLLRERVRAAGLDGRVFLHGYRQTGELAASYAMADVVLFPSLVEVFGLVMVEAAACGVPVIASLRAGGTPDVVVDGETGLVVDPADTRAFADTIARLLDDPLLRATMGAAAAERARTLMTIDRSAGRIIEAIRAVE